MLARSEADGLEAARCVASESMLAGLRSPKPTGGRGIEDVYRAALRRLAAGSAVVPGPGAAVDRVAFQAGWRLVLGAIDSALDASADAAIRDTSKLTTERA